MKKYFLIPLALTLIAGLILGGCATPAPSTPPASKPAPAPAPVAPIELKFSYHTGQTTATTAKFLIPWAKKVEEATKGRVKIVHYPSETLTKSNQSWEATIGGSTDINWLVQGFFPGKFPLSEVATLPFLNLNSGKVDGNVIYGGEINSRLFEELYEKSPEIQKEYSDVKVLFVWSSSSQFLITKKPVSSQETLKGLKIRTLGGPPSDMIKALGGTPVLMGLPDIYEALDKGVIDGIEFSWGGTLSNKYYYPCHYFTDMNTTVAQFAIIMNREKWNSLPKDIQDAIMSVSGMMGAQYAGGAAFGKGEPDELMAAAKKDNQAFEKVSLVPGESQRWIDSAGKPIWDKWVADKSSKGLPAQKILDTINSLIEKYRIP
jgi:TRAP-type C4-dicarboxylate transport system substrate-binding protein